MTWDTEQYNRPQWWNALLSLVEFVTKGKVSFDDDGAIQKELRQRGFLEEDILTALEWFEKAQLTGNIFEIISMLEPRSQCIRVEHPVERQLISEKLWREILSFHEKGVLSSEITEKLLEGLRAIDTSDWEEEEIRLFINEIISLLKNKDEDNLLKGYGRKKTTDFYC